MSTTTLANEIARIDFAKGTYTRQCRSCGEEFMGEGIQTICDACHMRPAPSKSTQQWHETWPRRAVADVALFTGKPLAAAHRILPAMQRNGTVAIIGDRGRGKTVTAAWLNQERMKAGKTSGLYLRAHDLFATIRRAWHAQSKEDEWTVLERFRNARFLVIDEFQERSESEWENRTLVNILDHRHGDNLPTLIIANLSAQDFEKHVGPSILDRIAQTGGIMECDWQSFRG